MSAVANSLRILIDFDEFHTPLPVCVQSEAVQITSSPFPSKRALLSSESYSHKPQVFAHCL